MDTTRAEQIALDDALILADVLKINMQEFWATATVHHHSIRFKINNKKHIVNLEYFREMLQICPKLPNQQFEELPFEEAILTFLRDLGHSGEIKMITDVNVNKLHQPWRSFVAVINKCLSGKSIGYDSLRLSQAQILWGMYHKKNVDYAYLMWEDFVYQVENKNVKEHNVKKSNEMDDYMFTMIKVVSRHEDTQLYGAILPNELMNEDIRNSKSYKEYYAIALGAEPPKTKASVKKKQVGSNKTTTPPKGKRLKTSAKAAKLAKKKQPVETSKAKGLIVLSEVALTEVEQLKLVIDRSKTQTHSSHASGSGADEGTGVIPGVPDVPTYNSDDEKISWKSSDEEDDDEDDDAQDKDDQDDENQDDDNEQTDSDNNGDDFVHPKFSTHDEEEREEESFDPRVQTPSHVESTDDEEVQGVNIKGEEMDEEASNEECEGNELYRDLNVNLEGRDVEMIDAQLPYVQATQETEDTHVIITAPINPEDVPVTTIAEPPLVSTTTLPLPPTPLITHMQQTPVPTPTTILRSSLQDLPNVGSLFGIVDAYLANKMHEAVKTVVQLQSKRVRDEAQPKNADFLNKLDDNIKKIIKDQRLKARGNELLHGSTETKTFLLSSKLSGILSRLDEDDGDGIVREKSDEGTRLLLDPNWGQEGDQLSSQVCCESAQQRANAHHRMVSVKRPEHQEFKTEATEDQSVDETPQPFDWFQKPTRLPSLDRELWNKTIPGLNMDLGNPWIIEIEQPEGHQYPHELAESRATIGDTNSVNARVSVNFIPGLDSTFNQQRPMRI
ncbi:hypothetical protein Tco_0436494 [Tanacetum coccineum]